MNCYRKEKIFFDKGLFDNIIDMIYVITLENSKDRHVSFKKQLNEFKLLKEHTIIYNKGFKNCKKVFCKYFNKCNIVNFSHEDLSHVNEYIRNDILINKYENVLVLEDDFILSKEITLDSTINNIKKLLQDYKNKMLVLRLGCIPLISSPYDENFKKIIFCYGAHAVLYNRNAILNYKSLGNDIDYNLNKYFKNIQLYYKTPLVYQLFPNTDNRNNWGRDFKYKILYQLFHIYTSFFINILNLNHYTEPGFTIIYKFHHFIIFMTIFIHFYFIYKIFVKIL